MTEKETSGFSDAISRKNLWIFTGSLSILLAASVVIFGLYILAMTVVAYVAALVVELLFAKFRKKPLDRAWMVTPLVLTLLLPPTVPLWIVAVGASFGVFFGKSLFGGLGKNVFNPAVVGVLFITISFPRFMNTEWLDPITNVIGTTAPIHNLYNGTLDLSFVELLLGNVPGTVGGTFRLGILVLGLGLILLKVIDWRIPFFYLGTMFVATFLGVIIAPDMFVDPLLTLMVGSVLFAAFFVATDPVTGPLHPKSKMIYGVGLGLLTLLIRYFAAFPEGVIFAVILMNAMAPLIDSFFIKEPLKNEEEDELKEAMA